MSISYTILFEVKLMHEYFLTTLNGATPFALPSPNSRRTFLSDAFQLGRDSIDNDITFRWAPGLATEANLLKLLPSYSGFRVAVRTSKKLNSDNDIVYEPETPLPAHLDLLVLIYQKNGSFNSYTNTRLSTALPAIYFFTNDRNAGLSNFPFLTGNIPSYDLRRNYEQGELVSFGVNDTRSFYMDGNNEEWQSVNGSSFANEGDRKLLPLKTYYSFKGHTGITEATFELKDKDDNLVWSLLAEDENGIEKVLLDFSSIGHQLALSPSRLLRDSGYTLNVSTNQSYRATHSILFADNIDWRGLWGAVHINIAPQDMEYNLLTEDGFLIKSKPAGAPAIDPPIFEIPIKSRSAFWRYSNSHDKALLSTATLGDYFSANDSMLVSKEPKAITQSDFKLKKPGFSLSMYVPNPTGLELKSDDAGRLYFDIVVPESDLFPTVPT